MNLTDVPDERRGPAEERPAFDELDSPAEALTGGSTKDRLLDVVVQLREPTKVSTVADRADCDTETARDYLQWFAEMGIVREHSGRPVRYERNESYFQWRRIQRLRVQYSEEEIVEALAETVDRIESYRDRFDAASPDEVSLLAVSEETSIEEAWKALSEWRTLERRATVLDAARRDGGPSQESVDHVDA